MPLGFRGGVWWLRARLATIIEVPGLSLDTIADQIGRSGIDFDIEQAAGTGDSGPWRGCRCVRSSRPAGTWRSTRRCTARQV